MSSIDQMQHEVQERELVEDWDGTAPSLDGKPDDLSMKTLRQQMSHDRATKSRRRHRVREQVRQEIEAKPGPHILPNKFLIQRELVTPERAAFFLDESEKVFKNRTVSENHIERLVSSIERGEFTDTGAPVCFTGNPFDPGANIDGQHRLWAVLISGIPLELTMLYGADRDAFARHDQGMRRSPAQILSMMGYTDTMHLASVIRHSYIYDKVKDVEYPYQAAPSIDQMLDFLEDNTELNDAAVDTRVIQRGTGTRIGTMGTCCWLFRQIDSDDTDYFLNKLATGADLAEDDPIYRLRERLRNHRLHSNKRIGAREVAALMIIAWNRFRDGGRMRQLAWKSGGANPQPFPEPR